MKMLKKALYFIPLIIGFILYTFISIVDGFNSINLYVWISLLVLFFSGALMDKNIWWGSFLGIAVGILLIYMGNQETGQIIKETLLGVIICIYYLICAIVSYKSKTNN